MMTVAAESSSREEKLLLTVEEAAHRLGIGRTVMYRLVSSGAVESVTLGRLRRVPSECLDEFVTTLRGSQAPKRHAATSAA
jgi:excisionase family DNA binding protein